MTSARCISVIINAGSGGGHDAARVEQLRARFAAAGADAEITLADDGAAIATALQMAIARRPDIIVGGGGDGTISSIAAELVASGIALGVLPLGTLNHFAKDLGVPLELDDAIGAIVDGSPVAIDVGEVNGRIFINNSSLGLYPDIVHDRERQQKRLGRGKWTAFAWSTIAALRRYPFMNARLAVDGRERVWRTPFIFIGNNEYRMDGFAIGERSRIDRGQLSLYVAQRPGRFRLLQLALRALAGRLKQARDFDALLATEIDVDSPHHRVRVATDGEVHVMTPPLQYRIRPASLRVMLRSAPSTGD